MYLNCKTFYSLRYGTYSTKELVEAGAEHGATTLGLTNINTTCDLWDFIRYCREANIKPVAGVEVRNGNKLLYILLASNMQGMQWIHEFLSTYSLQKKNYPGASPTLRFFNHPEDGFVVYPLGAKPWQQLLSNEYIGILHKELALLIGTDWRAYESKFVIRHPVSFQDKTYHNLHRLLRAIDDNTLLSKQEAKDYAPEDEVFVPSTEIFERFKQYPAFVNNTYRLMESCDIEFNYDGDKNRACFSTSPQDDQELLVKLAKDGLLKRYGARNKQAAARLEKELRIINDLGFNSYFLMNWDIVRYAQFNGYYSLGRGSGANSIVAYCLGITDVDPVELNLYFERFLNPHRTSPPDFDLDFSWTDRDEIMDYIFKRYGRNHVALLGSYTTFREQSSIRQLGKVFGLPDDEIKILQRTVNPQGYYPSLISKYSALMKRFPDNLTLHPCGMLISDKPITTYATLFMPPKGFLTAQIDMFVAESIGLNKFDILSQRGLGHIKEAKRLVLQNRGIDVDVHDFKKFKQDPAIKQHIREGDTIGCFYVESPAMRQLLKKLGCADYLTLVAASSIIRPGVAESGMMKEYIYRYHNRDAIQYLHPLFEEHLSETFGVMVFQEDVIKIAHYFAGLDLGEADILRRAMSGKYRSNNEFEQIRQKFMSNCAALGHPEALAEEVWRQMKSFGGYSFNKAHSASFAVESYMSLYLKTHFPKEFMVAVINNFGGFYTRELYFLELLKTGSIIQAPCINNSDEYTNINGDEVYVGFIHIKGLQRKLTETIIEERKQNGPYLHLQDFIERTNTGLEQLNRLISIGAFRFTGKTKKRLLWEANFLQRNNQPMLHGRPVLFKESPLEFELPYLSDHPIDDLYDQMEILGFTLSNPFDLVDDDPAKYTPAAAINNHKGKVITVLTYFINRKHVITKYNQEMFFGTFIDAALNWIDTVHFPDAAERFPLHQSGFYRIKGRVVEEFGVYSVEVSSMIRVGYKPRTYQNLG